MLVPELREVVVQPGMIEDVKVDVEGLILKSRHLHGKEHRVPAARLEGKSQRVQVHRGVLVQLGRADLDAGEYIFLRVVEAQHVIGIVQCLISFLL